MGRYLTQVRDILELPATVTLVPEDEADLRRSGSMPPSPVAVRLIIDTGSARSCLIPAIISRLKPIASRALRVETSAGVLETALYWVRMEFPRAELEAVSYISVARVPMPARLRDFHGVVGRDLLGRWDSLLYEGKRGRLTIRDSRGGLWRWFGSR